MNFLRSFLKKMEKEKKESKELTDYRHKLKMKELEFLRQSDLLRYNQFHSLEKQKHDWRMEEQRINFAESRKLQEARIRSKEYQNRYERRRE